MNGSQDGVLKTNIFHFFLDFARFLEKKVSLIAKQDIFN